MAKPPKPSKRPPSPPQPMADEPTPIGTLDGAALAPPAEPSAPPADEPPAEPLDGAQWREPADQVQLEQPSVEALDEHAQRNAEQVAALQLEVPALACAQCAAETATHGAPLHSH